VSKQALVRAVAAHSLKFDANLEATREIDRVAALGLATRRNALGAELIHAEAHNADSARRAILHVARALIKRQRLARRAAERIAQAALFENINAACNACGGRGFQYAGAAVSVCVACNGTRLHRYSDAARASLCGLGHYPRAAYETALCMIRDALSAAAAGAARRL
jgi:hypothetical protein